MLSLAYTNIQEIPKEIVNTKLILLNVENTPLKEPPLFCAMRGLKSIKTYFASQESSKDDKDSKGGKSKREGLLKSMTSVQT